LDSGTRKDFSRLIALVKANFQQVRVTKEDETPQRSILELFCTYGRYAIRIYEIVSDVGRKYSYYVFDGDYIVAGFDNSADLTAIHLKYGRDYKFHRHELTPHLHTENKTKLELTDEMTCQDFIEWVKANLPQ
jgi:SAM-dependent methyltransferase